MQVGLSSPLRKVTFTAACLLLSSMYAWRTGRTFVASRLAERVSLGSLETAVRLEPTNAEYHARLGRHRLFDQQEVNSATREFTAATTLNPYVARYWLDSASAYLVQGDAQRIHQVLSHALELDPQTPDVAWAAAIFELTQGNTEGSLRDFRTVVANDASMAVPALRLCWRATHDVDRILQLSVPARADSYLALMQVLIERNEPDAAAILWTRLKQLRQSFDPQLAFGYVQFLIDARRATAARVTWEDLVGLNQKLRPYAASADNLVVNGGFDEDVLNEGLDWRYQSVPGAEITLDSSTFHDGRRALHVTYQSASVQDSGVFQYVPLQPNTTYELSWFSRTDNMNGASGPRLYVADAYTRDVLLLTEDLRGAPAWQSHKTRFQTGNQTEVIVLGITRQPAMPKLAGNLWIDDVRLQKR
jgi:tetratricopeptide (TPR) repeat protein